MIWVLNHDMLQHEIIAYNSFSPKLLLSQQKTEINIET